MATVKPFRALRPVADKAAEVAAPPYDVLNSDEAREMAKDNPISFLHVNKPEIDLPKDTDVYSEKVYQKGAENLKSLIEQNILIREEMPCYYFYRQVMGRHEQTGLVARASVAEYDKGIIKKHEFTRPVKEDDRVKHMEHLNAQVGPVFLTYKATKALDELAERVCENEPVYDFKAADGIRHTAWVVDEESDIKAIEENFAKIDFLYVADGHHRSAAASRVAEARKKANVSHRGSESYNYFLTVIFPHDQMYIMDYNRVVADLNGLSKDQFQARVAERFHVDKTGREPKKPTEKNEFAMYLDGDWYHLCAMTEFFNPDHPVDGLDVSILQNNLLSPILGIGDPRKDPRIDFVGGIRGLEELKRRVDSGEMAVAFALKATSIEELMAIADAGEVMPPKSTWFEPKLRSGLFIHVLD